MCVSFQYGRRRGSGHSTPVWLAISNWWLLAKAESVFFRNVVLLRWMVNGLSSMHKQEVLHGLNGWERKVVGEDKIRIGGEGIGWAWLKHIVSMYTILNKKNNKRVSHGTPQNRYILLLLEKVQAIDYDIIGSITLLHQFLFCFCFWFASNH